MSELHATLLAAIQEDRPYILITIIAGAELEILFGGNPEHPPTWADVAEMLAYAAECAAENAEETDGAREQDRAGPGPADGGRPGEGAPGPADRG